MIEDKKGEGNLNLKVTLNLPPVLTAKDNRLVTLAKTYGEQHLDNAILVSPTMGVTDASNLMKGKDVDFPLVIFGPGNPAMAHQTDEYVEKETYIKFIEIYKEIATDYLGEETN